MFRHPFVRFAVAIVSLLGLVMLTAVITTKVNETAAQRTPTAILAGRFEMTEEGSVLPWSGEISIGGAGYEATMSPHLWDDNLILPHPSQPVTATVWLQRDGTIDVTYEAAMNADPQAAQAFHKMIAEADWSDTIRDMVIDKQRAYMESAHLHTCIIEETVDNITCRTLSGKFVYRYQYISPELREQLQRTMPLVTR